MISVRWWQCCIHPWTFEYFFYGILPWQDAMEKGMSSLPCQEIQLRELEGLCSCEVLSQNTSCRVSFLSFKATSVSWMCICPSYKLILGKCSHTSNGCECVSRLEALSSLMSLKLYDVGEVFIQAFGSGCSNPRRKRATDFCRRWSKSLW